ncbi:uncharacterized protein BXZ73DRAFT_46912 [Epithele typhae]|uniref:uncharacterized protein n=1 Tax=Epithele typhae TaxID=378194 RepID=UPI002008BAE7|nr:uncharacterized protein BXZ73DRAFT_46912 [Epithele typhae]KAH9932096.1 hypothetical protein BXZ73DRAFT_46912 [Epithele typhae]
MSGFTLVDPKGWDCDLQSVYSAYMGHFQLHNVPRHGEYDRSWAVFFETFEEFLTFSWPTITVTDTWTGRAHIVVRASSISAFLKMLKTRFGETVPMVENILRVAAFETQQRHMRTISDYTTYRKIYATLPAVVLAAQKTRVRSGEPQAVRELWAGRDKTFLALDFEWSERNTASCIEWGYSAVRCGHLSTAGAWPPDPEPNYRQAADRRGHYLISEYVDKVYNKIKPSFPRAVSAFGESQLLPKARLGQVVNALISSLMSPDSELVANTLVLVTHGTPGEFRRLEELKIKLPHNVLILDTMAFERQLYASGQRGTMQEPSGRPRDPATPLTLAATLQSLGFDATRVLHNAGNAALTALLALQLLLAPDTPHPTPRAANALAGMAQHARRSMHSASPGIAFGPSMSMPMYPAMGMGMGIGRGIGVPAQPFPTGLVPDGFVNGVNGHDGAGSRASYFPNHRPASGDGHRLSAPGPLTMHGGRAPGRTRVSSMNDLNKDDAGAGGVSELGEQMGGLHVRARTSDSRGLPQSR